MPCYQSTNLPSGITTTGRTSYKTEADCLQACREGACCEGTTCSVKPQCQCQGTGKTFKGVGTTCSPNPCVTPCIPCCESGLSPSYINVTLATSVTGVVCRQTTATTTAGPYPNYTASKTVTLSKASIPENNPFSACYRWTFADDYESQWAATGYAQRSEPIATVVSVMIAKNCSGAACAMWWSVSQSVTLNGLDSGRVVLFNGSTCGSSPRSDSTGGLVLSSAIQAVAEGQCFGSLPSVSSSYAITSSGVLWNASSASHSLVVNGVQW